MYLNDVAMVAADTSRTKYYLTEMIKYKLTPSHIVLLLNKSENSMPGQEKSGNNNALTTMIEKEGISYEVSPNSDINSEEVVAMISSRYESVFVFSGFGGVLLRDDILGTGKKFLHVHGGYLPEYKGSTTNYYSLIDDNTIGASSIFLTKEIDCGPVLLRKKINAPDDRTKLDHVHDSDIRAKVLIETLRKYVSSGDWEFELEDNKGGETYYIIHPVLKHLAILGEGA